MRKISIIGLLALLTGCGSSELPVEPHRSEWGEEISGLRSRISSPRRQILSGEIPLLVFELRNVSEHEIVTTEFGAKSIDYDALTIEYLHRSGSIVFPLADTDWGRKPDRQLRIASGETVRAEVELVPQSDEDRSWLWQLPGIYTLQWRVSKPAVRALEKPLESNLLTIEVIMNRLVSE